MTYMDSYSYLLFFNSHPHKEDDCKLSFFSSPMFFSTHILTRRMTDSMLSFSDGNIFSTHILTRRMTERLWYLRVNLVFQLTSSQGG